LLGLSQGGAMVYRLCLEIPDEITAATVVAANLSVKKTLDMDSVKKPVSMLIINGVKDPICPYSGGEINILHLIKRGYVYSAKTTVTYWANCAGYNSPTSTDSLVTRKTKKLLLLSITRKKVKKIFACIVLWKADTHCLILQ
jgi:poly(3-hydroxybutyrate) depolymerase